MKFLTMIVVLSVLAACSNQADNNVHPRIDSVVPFYSAYVMPRNVDIWLPRQYQISAQKHFPVIYMQDGQNLFDHTKAPLGIAWDIDDAAQRLIDKKIIQPAIIVAIWSTPQRRWEYFPDHVAGSDIPLFLADNYLKFIVQELKPYIDSHYRTLADQRNTSVAGSSLGALISLQAFLEYPEIFGNLACIATDWGRLFGEGTASHTQGVKNYIERKLPPSGHHRLYFDYSTATLGRYYEPHQQMVEKIMRSKGYQQGMDWVTEKIPGSEKDENTWYVRKDEVLEFLLGN